MRNVRLGELPVLVELGEGRLDDPPLLVFKALRARHCPEPRLRVHGAAVHADGVAAHRGVGAIHPIAVGWRVVRWARHGRSLCLDLVHASDGGGMQRKLTMIVRDWMAGEFYAWTTLELQVPLPPGSRPLRYHRLLLRLISSKQRGGNGRSFIARAYCLTHRCRNNYFLESSSIR